MRKFEFAANLIWLMPFFVALGIVAICACLITHPLNILLVCACYTAGIASLLYAKMSLFRQGIWFSFGPALMDTDHHRSYWSGYIAITVGVVLQALLIVMQR